MRELSGYQNPTLAFLLLVVAVVWGGWALLTWTTFRRYLWALYWFVIEPLSGPRGDDFQRLADALIDQMYLAENPEGISKPGREREHAPEGYRAEWYGKYGLPKPKPHKARYR